MPISNLNVGGIHYLVTSSWLTWLVLDLLAPLTSVADLPNHPTLSKPYLSNAIPKLTEQASSLLRKEKAALWRMKQLLTKFRGDETWVPCGIFETGNDIMLFRSSYTVPQQVPPHTNHIQNKVAPEGTQQDQHISQTGIEEDPTQVQGVAKEALTIGQGDAETKVERSENNEAVAMNEPVEEPSEPTDTEPKTVEQSGNEKQDTKQPDQDRPPENPANADTTISDQQRPPQDSTTAASDGADQTTAHDTQANLPDPRPQSSPKSTEQPGPAPNDMKLLLDEGEQPNHSVIEPQPPSHRMTTRLRAQATTNTTTTSSTTTSASTAPSPTPAQPSSYPIHPIFLVPPSARPDRDFGLPPAEAEETRRLLMLYVQKQEEVCRGAWRLYEGLLKADRLRQTVFRWAKAEAHVGEMSDGEDWYDKEEWGLDEDLKKGHDEDEDDGPGGVGGVGGAGAGPGPGGGAGNERAKKTRSRRA